MTELARKEPPSPASPGGASILWLHVGILAFFSLYPFYLALFVCDGPRDDEYITLTYAKNLAAGKGFVFNAPPPALGSTTPLQTFLMAGLMRVLPVDPVRLLPVCGALFWCAAAWLVFVCRNHLALTPLRALVVSLVLLTSCNLLTITFECNLFFFLMLAATFSVLSGRPLLGGALTGALFLTRGEGALLGPLLLCATWFPLKDAMPSRRALRASALYAAGTLLVLVPWSIYAYTTFGAVLPQTLEAKMIQADVLRWPRFTNVWWKNLDFLTFFGEKYANWFFYYPLIAIGLPSMVRAWRTWSVLAVWLVAYITAYKTLDVAWYYWYNAMPFAFIAFAAAHGLAALVALALRLPKLGPIAGAAIAAVTFAGIAWPHLPPLPTRQESVVEARYRAYRAIARWLRENATPDEAIALGEVGHIGYYTNQPVFDLCGLVTPRQLEFLAKKDFSGGFWEARPAYLATFADAPNLGMLSPEREPRFQIEYGEVLRIPIATPPGDAVLYARKGETRDTANPGITSTHRP